MVLCVNLALSISEPIKYAHPVKKNLIIFQIEHYMMEEHKLSVQIAITKRFLSAIGATDMLNHIHTLKTKVYVKNVQQNMIESVINVIPFSLQEEEEYV